MAQINARVSDDLASHLDRLAAKRGTDRANLVRDVLTEAVDADREGRVMFDQPEMPGPQDLARLAAKLDQQTIELDRILRQNAKRDAELARQAREDTLGVSEARGAIVNDVVAQQRSALESVQGELMRTREELTALIDRHPQLVAMDKKLDQVLEAARQPRVKKTYNIGLGDWPWPALLSAGAIALVAGMFAFMGLAAVLPDRWLGIRTANRLLGGGDTAICALANFRYDTSTCRVRVNGREVDVAVGAPGTIPLSSKDRRR